jgi:hypothetical protein
MEYGSNRGRPLALLIIARPDILVLHRSQLATDREPRMCAKWACTFNASDSNADFAMLFGITIVLTACSSISWRPICASYGLSGLGQTWHRHGYASAEDSMRTRIVITQYTYNIGSIWELSVHSRDLLGRFHDFMLNCDDVVRCHKPRCQDAENWNGGSGRDRGWLVGNDGEEGGKSHSNSAGGFAMSRIFQKTPCTLALLAAFLRVGVRQKLVSQLTNILSWLSSVLNLSNRRAFFKNQKYDSVCASDDAPTLSNIFTASHSLR